MTCPYDAATRYHQTKKTGSIEPAKIVTYYRVVLY